MSRNWTPEEMLMVEKTLPNGATWRDMTKSMTITFKGQTSPMVKEEDNNILDSYDYLGRLYPDNLCGVYRKLKEVDKLSVLEEVENELKNYIENNVGDKETPLIRWYHGKLDSNFYYSEYNNQLLAEAIFERAGISIDDEEDE